MTTMVDHFPLIEWVARHVRENVRETMLSSHRRYLINAPRQWETREFEMVKTDSTDQYRIIGKGIRRFTISIHWVPGGPISYGWFDGDKAAALATLTKYRLAN